MVRVKNYIGKIVHKMCPYITHTEFGRLTHGRGRVVVRGFLVHGGQIRPGVGFEEVAGLLLLILSASRGVLSGLDEKLKKDPAVLVNTSLTERSHR